MLGRFVAFVRAVMPAAAGAVRRPYRTFPIYNVLGGLVWGVGYCLLGYLAGSAYGAVERRVGTGLAVAVADLVAALGRLGGAPAPRARVRRHRTRSAARASQAGDDRLPDAGDLRAEQHGDSPAGRAGRGRGTKRRCGAAFIPYRSRRSREPVLS